MDFETVQNDIYLDDCLSGEENVKKVLKRADDLELVLNRGGFTLKGITFTESDPPSALLIDDSSDNLAGMKWFPKKDLLALDIGELNFAKMQRGKKPVQHQNIIPSKFTRRSCVSKKTEIFDLTGKRTPITAAIKIDLHILVKRGLSWDHDLRSAWVSHFNMMQEIGNLRFQRAFVPEDAVNLDINTIDAVDASNKMVCVAIYARFLRRNGIYSCQLVFSRSKVVPDGIGQSRAELLAATLNTHVGETVTRAFQDNHKRSVKLSDSQVTLHWINNQKKPLKQWVRSRVVEINRLTQPKDWMFVKSEDIIADIGTRRVSDLDVVGKDSVWINGFDWMKWDKSYFPAKTIDEIKLKSEEISALENEILKYSSEMAKGLMANKGDKSYLISDVYETIAVDSYQRKIPSKVL